MKGNNIFEPDKVFFTSDTHFSHKNIIKYCNRPFSDVVEMNKVLIDNWNKVVSEGDIVFHLGDFAFGGFPLWESIRDCLNGSIYLIQGNHDFKQNFQNKERFEKMFEKVVPQAQISVGGQTMILNHYPFLCYHGTWGTDQNCWNLMGHVHTLRSNNSGKDFERLQYLFPMQYDVGVDFNNYTPISFQEVKEKIDFQVKNNVNMLYWVKS